MSGSGKRRLRKENAINRLEKTITEHEANAELTKRILEDKGLTDKTSEEIEKLRKKKIERAKTALENTKKNLNA